MKVAFAFNEYGNFNCNTLERKFHKKIIGSYLVVDIPDEIYHEQKRGEYLLRSNGFCEEIIHYFDEIMDVWVLHPSDAVTKAKEVSWNAEIFSNEDENNNGK